ASHLNTPATLFVALQKMDHYSQTISTRKFKFCTYLKDISYLFKRLNWFTVLNVL
ncbi:hypothetical protein L9F63_012910, partial [Diploptera punctata]